MMIFLLAILLKSFSCSSEIKFDRIDGKVVASAPNCYELNAEVPSFRQWLRQTHPERACHLGLKAVNNGCNMDLSGCLPDHALKYHGTSPKLSGPNCWNLALVMREMIPALRYSPPGEMSFFMRSPLCKKIPLTEPKMPGDIGAIRRVSAAGESEEIHGFIFISDRLAYSKNGFSRQSPYQLQTVQDVLTAYDTTSSLHSCNSLPPEIYNNENSNIKIGTPPRPMELNPKVCPRTVEVYRCQTPREYLATHTGQAGRLAGLLFRADYADRCASNMAFSQAPPSQEETRNIEDSVKALVKYMNDNKRSLEKSDEKTQFLFASLMVRLNSAPDQVGVIRNNQKEEFQGYFPGSNSSNENSKTSLIQLAKTIERFELSSQATRK